MEFVDSHFHYWDVDEKRSPSGHSIKVLGDIAIRFPKYLPEHYLNDLIPSFNLKKAVFIEAISDKPLSEAKWVDSISRGLQCTVQCGIVAYAPLEDNTVETLLQEYAKLPTVKGIRQILNHHPTNPNLTWPKVPHDFFDDPNWVRGFSLLAKYNFSFDLQLNPHQMPKAAALLQRFPTVPVVIDHLGNLHLGDGSKEEEEKAIKVWTEGMQRLARLPQVHVKISMLMFTKKGWETSKPAKDFLRQRVREVIGWFGVQRCMVGTNFPVDLLSASSGKELAEGFRDLLTEYSQTEQRALYYETANRFYRLDSLSSKL